MNQRLKTKTKKAVSKLHKIIAIDRKQSWWKNALRTALYAALLLAFLLFSLGAYHYLSNRSESTNIGVTFSHVYAEYYDLDAKDALRTILDRGAKHLRLMTYWEVVEPQNGTFDYSAIDWQLDMAEEYGAEVMLTVGYKQPRWPECHEPNWAKQITDDSAWEAELLEYVDNTVKYFADRDIIKIWQLENEPDLVLFASCRTYNPERLEKELELIKENDYKNRPVLYTHSQSRVPLFQEQADMDGYSLYKQAYFVAFGRQIPWNYWFIPSWWHGARAQMSEWTNVKPIIAELQAEPWGPIAIKDQSNEQQLSYTNAKTLKDNVAFANRTGMSDIYLWGAEWWVWREVQFDDSSLLDSFEELAN